MVDQDECGVLGSEGLVETSLAGHD